VIEKDVINEVALRSLEVLHYGADGADNNPACAAACYECLLDYFNQREHRHLDRKVIHEILLWLKDAKPQATELNEWQKLIDSCTGPGAANERKFLEMIRDQGLPLPSRSHYALPESGSPIAEIDFQVGRVHVLVDGSIHHQAWVSDVDSEKRRRLRLAGYTVHEVRTETMESDVVRLRELL
jgi:hypothetical protein